MQFTKMHGLGNDFILVDDREGVFPTPENGAGELARAMCDRRAGIGADGVLLLQNCGEADIQMRIYNNDGSVAEMCGNGIRCFAKYAYDRGVVRQESFSVLTGAGEQRAWICANEGVAAAVRICLGQPLLRKPEIPMAGEGACNLEQITALGRTFTIGAARLGVPHIAVFLQEDITEEDICKYGAALEHHPLFPQRANVNFVQIAGENTLRIRTWERGCGRTLACGTGSGASAVLAARAGYTGRHVTVQLQLGELDIVWAEDGVYMTGPAAYVFEGTY
ncbi:MAG: diaminopimelate epimerase [Christensenellaceae bacterium]|jgi:diaminopimelate epimerase|nr:diaminopimelate epimerase [Christensenellaceae bacterium]